MARRAPYLLQTVMQRLAELADGVHGDGVGPGQASVDVDGLVLRGHGSLVEVERLPMLDETGYAPEWKYVPDEELRRHAVHISEPFGLYEDALFSTAVTSLARHGAAQQWVVAGRGDELRATYVISATGTLTEPKLPGIRGVEDYRGHASHTSRWDHACTGGSPEGGTTGLAGKRVGIVGTGATGVQVITVVAEDAQRRGSAPRRAGAAPSFTPTQHYTAACPWYPNGAVRRQRPGHPPSMNT